MDMLERPVSDSKLLIYVMKSTEQLQTLLTSIHVQYRARVRGKTKNNTGYKMILRNQD